MVFSFQFYVTDMGATSVCLQEQGASYDCGTEQIIRKTNTHRFTDRHVHAIEAQMEEMKELNIIMTLLMRNKVQCVRYAFISKWEVFAIEILL